MSNLYKVEGVDKPLRLSAEHAEQIGATLVENGRDYTATPAASAPKADWVAWAVTARELDQDAAQAMTLAELKALAEA